MENQQKVIGYDGVIEVEAEEDKLAEDDKRVEDDILREFNADGGEKEWRITVKKVDPRTKKQDTCFILSPDEIHTIFDRLNGEFGPGVYRAYVTCNNILKRNLEYRIAKKLDKPSYAEPNSPINDIAALVSKQNEQIAAIAQGGHAAPTDPMAMFTAMMGAIASMKEVFTPPPPPNPADSMKLFLEAMTLAREFSSDKEGSPSNMYDMVTAIVNSPLGQSAAEQVQNFRAGQQSLPAPENARKNPKQAPMRLEPRLSDPHFNEAKPQTAAPRAIQEMLPEMREQLEGQLRMWNERANNGSDPALYADVVLDTFDPAVIHLVLLRPDLQEIAQYLVPETAANWEWFQSFIHEINHGLTQDMENDDNGNNDPLTQPESAIPVDAPSSAPDKRPAASNANGNPQRSGGDKGDAQINAETGSPRKKEPSRKAAGAKPDTTPKTKRPARGG